MNKPGVTKVQQMLTRNDLKIDHLKNAGITYTIEQLASHGREAASALITDVGRDALEPAQIVEKARLEGLTLTFADYDEYARRVEPNERTRYQLYRVKEIIGELIHQKTEYAPVFGDDEMAD